MFLQPSLKVALQILGRTFYENTKKSSLYSQSLLSFNHKTPTDENHPTTREIRDILRPRSTPTGNTVYFVAFVEDNATMSSVRYFENHVSKFCAKPKEVDRIKPISL